MNSRQKEVIGQSLADEKAVLNALTDNYTTALADIKKNIRELQANPLTQSKAYQLEYQKQLETMVSGVLDSLQGSNFNSIAEYLQNSYTNSYIGNLYDMHGQGVPLILPMNENQVVKAVQKTGDDFKLSEKLGGNTKELKKQVKSELQRGLASALPYETMARSISDYGQADLNRSMRIARTEGHRIQSEAKLDCMNNAKKKGANIVKQWDSTLDGRTRPEHKQLDGQIREIDEDFEVDGYSAQGPGGFGDPYMDCNCRCCLLQRAKWALDDEELKTLQDRAEYFGLDKSQNFQDFKDKYINAVEFSANSDIIELRSVDARDKLKNIDTSNIQKLKSGFSCFPKDDLLNQFVKKVKSKDGYYDVSMHGTPNAMCFGTDAPNTSPRLLANVIRRRKDYNGENIRLLSCSTGKIIDDNYCFAEELSNALGVCVEAPNDELLIGSNGLLKVGRTSGGQMITYKPNERGRMK
jgi:hypothetical protein